jgi:hypothetical protein
MNYFYFLFLCVGFSCFAPSTLTYALDVERIDPKVFSKPPKSFEKWKSGVEPQNDEERKYLSHLYKEYKAKHKDDKEETESGFTLFLGSLDAEDIPEELAIQKLFPDGRVPTRPAFARLNSGQDFYVVPCKDGHALISSQDEGFVRRLMRRLSSDEIDILINKNELQIDLPIEKFLKDRAQVKGPLLRVKNALEFYHQDRHKDVAVGSDVQMGDWQELGVLSPIDLEVASGYDGDQESSDGLGVDVNVGATTQDTESPGALGGLKWLFGW